MIYYIMRLNVTFLLNAVSVTDYNLTSRKAEEAVS